MISASITSRRDKAHSESLATLKGLLSPSGTRNGKHNVPISQQRLTGKQPVKSSLRRRPRVTDETFGRHPEMSERHVDAERFEGLSLQGMEARRGRTEGEQTTDAQGDDVFGKGDEEGGKEEDD
nr:hypothetical protein CFP56_77250 [Quercus suber]